MQKAFQEIEAALIALKRAMPLDCEAHALAVNGLAGLTQIAARFAELLGHYRGAAAGHRVTADEQASTWDCGKSDAYSAAADDLARCLETPA